MAIAESFEQRAGALDKGSTISFYLKDAGFWIFGLAALSVLYACAIMYQQAYGHLYGLDSHAPEFETYWMTWFWTEIIVVPLLGVALSGYLWFTRERNWESVSPKEEIRRYFSLVMFLCVYTFAVYWGGSYFAEQDGSWHQVVTRDTSFTPSHIMIFYLSFPVFMMLGVGSLVYAWTRLPMYHFKGVSVPHVLAVVGPFMILPNVGLNEWGHAFWFMEELFTAPLHWGFVVLGWSALALGGVLLQIVQRVNTLLPMISEEKAA